MVLEKTLESPLDCKEIQPVHPKGNQSRVFTGGTDAKSETPVICTSAYNYLKISSRKKNDRGISYMDRCTGQ